ncbi:MAG: hypothetical protein PHQ60_02290 [Sideroxydans sp.]|nr:hypothetical protein [Sideroxydans sp.]MDD5056673.1 hypothetical protein [Sideroxydans sp.]
MESIKNYAEYEQRKIFEMRDTAAQRQSRKVLRTRVMASRVPSLSLSVDGDMLLFDGQAYSLFYAHGNLQVERAFTMHLQKKGYCSSTRQKIHGQVKKLVAGSPLSCNILGAEAAN